MIASSRAWSSVLARQFLFQVIAHGVGTSSILQLSGGILHRAGLRRSPDKVARLKGIRRAREVRDKTSADVLNSGFVAFDDWLEVLHQGFNGEFKNRFRGQFDGVLLLASGHLAPVVLGILVPHRHRRAKENAPLFRSTEAQDHNYKHS